MRHGVVGFSLVLFWNSHVDHDSVEGLFSMGLFPGEHSSDNSPDVVVRPSRMSWSFFLVAEGSCFQCRLRPGDNSGLCPRDNGTFGIQHDHLLSFKGLFRDVACHSSQDQIGCVNNFFFWGETCNQFFQLSVIPPSPSPKPTDFVLIIRAASRTIFSGGIVPVDSTRNVNVRAFSSWLYVAAETDCH